MIRHRRHKQDSRECIGSESGRSHACGREKGWSDQAREIVALACALSGVVPLDVVGVEGASEPEECVYVPCANGRSSEWSEGRETHRIRKPTIRCGYRGRGVGVVLEGVWQVQKRQ